MSQAQLKCELESLSQQIFQIDLQRLETVEVELQKQIVQKEIDLELEKAQGKGRR